MTTNSDSRKRRRLTSDGDPEALSDCGRMECRDMMEDRGLLSGRMNGELGYSARDVDASSYQVGEAMDDNSMVSRS